MLRLLQLVVILYTVKNNIISTDEIVPQYKGQLFPSKYLRADSVLSTSLDLEHYLKHMNFIVGYFSKTPNATESSVMLCMHISRSVLKRTLLDYRGKLQEHHIRDISKTINKIEDILSHFRYVGYRFKGASLLYKIVKWISYDAGLIHAIGSFNKNRLTSWILSNETIHNFVEELDDATLSKRLYTYLVEADGYYIQMRDSDTCLSRIYLNLEPIDVSLMQPCKRDPFCEYHIHNTPSIGYSLSHRLLNLVSRSMMWRCYMKSETADLALADQLCAFMYREAVYLARRGFFARDLFMEHISLCAIMGYEEFHRRSWFHKIMSWIDSDGCVEEFHNYNLNRTSILLESTTNPEIKVEIYKWSCSLLHQPCQSHPAGLAVAVMSHAVRHAAHLLPSVHSTNRDID